MSTPRYLATRTPSMVTSSTVKSMYLWAFVRMKVLVTVSFIFTLLQLLVAHPFSVLEFGISIPDRQRRITLSRSLLLAQLQDPMHAAHLPSKRSTGQRERCLCTICYMLFVISGEISSKTNTWPISITECLEMCQICKVNFFKHIYL